MNQVRAKPAMLTNCMKDRAVQPDISVAMFRHTLGDQRVVAPPDVGHFGKDDAPEKPVALIQAFVRRS